MFGIMARFVEDSARRIKFKLIQSSHYMCEQERVITFLLPRSVAQLNSTHVTNLNSSDHQTPFDFL